MSRGTLFAVVLAAGCCLGPSVAAAGEDPPGPSNGAGPVPDAERFFARLVERYRRLESYDDRVSVVETVQREGEPADRVERRMRCRIADGTLQIETPGTQVAAGAGLGTGLSGGAAMEALVLRYNLWQAPHLALRFLDEPLREFRAGVPGGFVVVEARRVATQDREQVRIELRAAEGGEPTAATFVLWTDPETLLIRRVEGSQVLPDGARLSVDLEVQATSLDG